MELWQTIADEAGGESVLWNDALLPGPARESVPVFSTLCHDTYALGLETIYEGYLCHYGRPRLFAPADDELALLLGDYLYAHGLVRIAETGSVDAVATLAELISADIFAARPIRIRLAPSITTTPSSSTPAGAQVITRAARR